MCINANFLTILGKQSRLRRSFLGKPSNSTNSVSQSSTSGVPFHEVNLVKADTNLGAAKSDASDAELPHSKKARLNKDDI